MALLFSAAEIADLRRKILATLTTTDLLQLNNQLQSALASVEAEAQSAGVAAGQAQASAGQAQMSADDAALLAAGAATPAYVQQQLVGLASKEYVDAAVSDKVTGTQLSEAIFDLATEGYVDGKFTGTYNSAETDASKVLIGGVYHPVVNGLIQAVP